MATAPMSKPKSKLTKEEAVGRLGQIIEGYFDDAGLNQVERDERYERLKQHLDSKDAAHAKSVRQH